MSAVGIIIAKENSIRFPGKNFHEYNGLPLFYHNVLLLKNCEKIDDVYVCTNSFKIINYCDERNIKTIFRPDNISFDEQPWFDVIKFAYYSLSYEYDILVSILANCIDHEQSILDSAIEKFIPDNSIKELRSFDNQGNQSGIVILRKEIVLFDNKISNHMASIKSNGKEKHFKEELK